MFKIARWGYFFFFNFSTVKMTRSLWNMYVKGIPNRACQGSSLLPFWGGWILWGNTTASTEAVGSAVWGQDTACWEPPGSLVVRTWSFHCHDLGSARGWGTEILQTEWCGKKGEKDIALLRIWPMAEPTNLLAFCNCFAFPQCVFHFLCVYTG